MPLYYRRGEVDDMTTCGALLTRGIARLSVSPAAGEADPVRDGRLDAQLLLSHVLGIPRSRLLSHPEAPCSDEAVRRFEDLLARRATGEPLAYLVGRREFWSLDLAVSPAVLVPRPETELLVERALTLGPPAAARVADLGTGSGAIALALASERPQWQVTATDVSAAALAVARANAERLGLPGIEFRLGDWFAALAGEHFDLVVSNPPYVGASDPALARLLHEPQLALTPGEDALASLRLLAGAARTHLAADGWLLLEHGAEQGAQVRAALVLAGFRHVRSHPDLAGRERITEGQR
jgi:release factor glutamine methyltransferase